MPGQVHWSLAVPIRAVAEPRPAVRRNQDPMEKIVPYAPARRREGPFRRAVINLQQSINRRSGSKHASGKAHSGWRLLSLLLADRKRKRLLHPVLETVQLWSGAHLAYRATMLGRFAANLFLDSVAGLRMRSIASVVVGEAWAR